MALALLRRHLGPEAGAVRAILAGWVAAAVPAFALFGARVALGHASPPSSAPPWTFAAWSVAVAPLVETALMLGLAWLLDRAAPGRDALHVAALAALLALAHMPGGGVVQAVAVAWPFVVYAAALVAWRSRSWAQAFLVVAAVHALYNATFIAFGAGFARGAPA